MLAEPLPDPNTTSLSMRVSGMAARFVARNSRSKLLDLRSTPPMVTFTFDDVPVSACELGAGILESFGARGTFFVAARGCGRTSPDGPTCASIDQLRPIWANGHEIGCHTYSHPAVRQMTIEELKSELDSNQAALTEINGNIVLRNFAYPYGDLSVRTKRYLDRLRFVPLEPCRHKYRPRRSRRAQSLAVAECRSRPRQDRPAHSRNGAPARVAHLLQP